MKKRVCADMERLIGTALGSATAPPSAQARPFDAPQPPTPAGPRSRLPRSLFRSPHLPPGSSQTPDPLLPQGIRTGVPLPGQTFLKTSSWIMPRVLQICPQGHLPTEAHADHPNQIAAGPVPTAHTRAALPRAFPQSSGPANPDPSCLPSCYTLCLPPHTQAHRFSDSTSGMVPRCK